MNNDEGKSTTSQESQVDEISANDAIQKEQSNHHQAESEQSVHNEKANETVDELNTPPTWHNKNVLKRGVAMLGYGFVAGFVRVGITLIAVFQFLSLLFAEKPNQPLIVFGQNLNTYLYQINQFLTINAEVYPFPFTEWPDSSPTK
jgi:hypothetical protein